MPTIFHCEHCGKKIEAKDGAGGKWAECPACHNEIYVPDLTADEDLKLAPIDESDEERKKRLMAETYALTQNILREREVPNEHTSSVTSTPETTDEELTKIVITYLRQMADGELDRAQTAADLIASSGTRAVKIIDKMALSEMPEPELADIPQQMLSGSIRSLREKIG